MAAVELVAGQRAGLGEQAADVQWIGVADGVGQANAFGAGVQRGL